MPRISRAGYGCSSGRFDVLAVAEGNVNVLHGEAPLLHLQNGVDPEPQAGHGVDLVGRTAASRDSLKRRGGAEALVLGR